MEAAIDILDIRIAIFIGILVFMAGWETLWPRRQLTQRKINRWFGNLMLVALDTIIVRLLLPAGAAGAALWAETHQFGLLHLTSLPPAATVLLAIILLDLAIYTQHVVFHAVPTLWRLHMVHHADRDLDVTSGLRFPPF
jgi:sterol desaturase/sphingolipid hydroxylase (fatty acid hydroxylase superfamily)